MKTSFLTSIISLFLSLMLSVSYANEKSKSKKSEACDESLQEQKPKKKRKAKEQKKAVRNSAQTRETLIEEIKEIIEDSENPQSKILMDHLHTSYVLMKATQENFWTLSLLVGNPDTVYTSEEVEDLEKVAKRINELGYFIIHDANSAAAPIISKACGQFSLAIGTSETPKNLRESLNNFTLIDDPYLRLFAFERSEHSTFSPDSLTGLAVLVNGKMNSHIPFVRSEFEGTMKNWHVSSQPYLGIPDYRTPSKITLPKVVLNKASRKFSADQILNAYEVSDLKGILATSEAIVAGRSAIEDATNKVGGALVIGSAKHPTSYVNKTYDIVKYFASQGVPVITGGSGGVMEIANAAAFDAGGVSIGVPITGEKSLKGEKNIFGSVHTLTVPSLGYASRLPLLTENRKLIVIAPGGGGTMKEIAVLLMKQAAVMDPEVVYVFIGAAYWDGVLNGLKKYLPKTIVEHIFTVDSEKEAKELFEELPKTVWQSLNLDKLRMAGEIKPRNDFKIFKNIEQRDYERRRVEALESRKHSILDNDIEDEMNRQDPFKLRKYFGGW